MGSTHGCRRVKIGRVIITIMPWCKWEVGLSLKAAKTGKAALPTVSSSPATHGSESPTTPRISRKAPHPPIGTLLTCQHSDRIGRDHGCSPRRHRCCIRWCERHRSSIGFPADAAGARDRWTYCSRRRRCHFPPYWQKLPSAARPQNEHWALGGW